MQVPSSRIESYRNDVVLFVGADAPTGQVVGTVDLTEETWERETLDLANHCFGVVNRSDNR